MRHRTPHTGPHAGRLCVVAEDGTLTPCAPVDSANAAPAVALPSFYTGGIITDGDLVPAGLLCGEPAGYDTRANRDKFARMLEDNGFANPAERAAEIVRRWDRGLRSGSIARKRD